MADEHNPAASKRQDPATSTKEPVGKDQTQRRIPRYQLLSESDLDRLHEASLSILSEVGVLFLHEEAKEILRQHGARVDGDTAYLDNDTIERYLSMAPSQFTQLARNPKKNVVIGGDHLCFAPVYGPPFVHDRQGGRRHATQQDFDNFVKLAYLSPHIHHSGGTIVEPNDSPVDTRHLDMLLSHIRYSDKPFMGSVTSAENAADSVALAEILFGVDAIHQDPALLSLINVSSPRQLDDRMLGALTTYARARQAVIITPFILSGAMAPVSIAGTIAQQNAEALAGLVYAQMVESGTPVVYGSFLTNVDLKSGGPVFGSPESQLGILASAQLAYRYGLPFRSGGMFASAKTSGAQASYESVMTMLPAVQAGTHFILHAAGWLENGLTAGYEKFALDCEVLGMLERHVQGLGELNDETMALDSIRQVPPGGHHLGTAYTMQHFRDAFYRAELFDYQDYDQWVAEGQRDALDRAEAYVQRALADYEPPELDQRIEAELHEYIETRKRELLPD
ncbi:MAG: trimethylamine methyltransferase family protein [Anaerolineales bacterium]